MQEFKYETEKSSPQYSGGSMRKAWTVCGLTLGPLLIFVCVVFWSASRNDLYSWNTMQKFNLESEDPTAKCNDGSSAFLYYSSTPAYALRNDPYAARRWVIVFEEEDGYCFSHDSCVARAENAFSAPTLSSSSRTATITGTGILSRDSMENAGFWDANFVLVGYCTSDLWAGASPGDDYPFATSTPEHWPFRGRLNALTAVSFLEKKFGLSDAISIHFAGGVGLTVLAPLLQARLTESVSAFVPAPVISFLLDGGWVPDIAPLAPIPACNSYLDCPLAVAVTLAAALWLPPTPSTDDSPSSSLTTSFCDLFPVTSDAWKCFYASYAARPPRLFVVQMQSDHVVLSSLGAPLTLPLDESTRAYAATVSAKLNEELAAAASQTAALSAFTAACSQHQVLRAENWETDFVVFDKSTGFWVSLPRAIRRWEGVLAETCGAASDSSEVLCNQKCQDLSSSHDL
jgi:hypothetical protein